VNPIFREAAATAQLGWLMGAMTVVFFVCFAGWAWWAYSSANRKHMDEAALLPLTLGDEA
jgi:cbb3-type cytochrome oxidase subunit 3